MPAAVYVAGTVLLTVYGQMIVKWRVDDHGSPSESASRLRYIADLFTDPWVATALIAAAAAAGCWMLALTKLELSVAYPFVSLSFVLVLIGSAVFFNETITLAKVIGIGLVLAGLAIASR